MVLCCICHQQKGFGCDCYCTVPNLDRGIDRYESSFSLYAVENIRIVQLIPHTHAEDQKNCLHKYLYVNNCIWRRNACITVLSTTPPPPLKQQSCRKTEGLPKPSHPVVAMFSRTRFYRGICKFILAHVERACVQNSDSQGRNS